MKKKRLRWSTVKRFLTKVRITKSNSCWTWLARKDKNGYGSFRLGKTMVLAHRFAWVLHTGELIPKGKQVLHNCDNPQCVNPAHLFLGSHKQNMQDMAKKGRAPGAGGKRLGSKNPNCKVTEKQVKLVRLRHAQGVKRKDIAAEFGLSPGGLDGIIYNRNWKHL